MEILHEAGVDPADRRGTDKWAAFLRSQADALLACDLFETVTLTGRRMFVLAVIEHTTRRIPILGATPHPTTAWVTRPALAENYVRAGESRDRWCQHRTA